MKILHCPTMVGGNPQGIARAQKELGHDARSLALIQTYLRYPTDEIVFQPNSPFLINEFRRWRAMLKSFQQYDVIHYNFGETLCPVRKAVPSKNNPNWIVKLYNLIYADWAEGLDLKLASQMNLITAVTYQGDDARQGDYCKKNYEIHFCHEVDDYYYTDNSDNLKRSRIQKFDRYADLIYSVNPDLMHVLPKRTRFTPYASVDPRAWKPKIYNDGGNIPHIVHAPSHRKVKGTDYILEAFHALEKEGISFRYSLIENMTNEEAYKIYQTADLLVDQLLAGFYGALSVELMALGKPVICYIREQDMHFLPPQMYKDMPIINATPATIYEVLKKYLTTDKHNLQLLGAHGRSYVERWHDPLKIGQDMLNDYNHIREIKNIRHRHVRD